MLDAIPHLSQLHFRTAPKRVLILGCCCGLLSVHTQNIATLEVFDLVFLAYDQKHLARTRCADQLLYVIHSR